MAADEMATPLDLQRLRWGNSYAVRIPKDAVERRVLLLRTPSRRAFGMRRSLGLPPRTSRTRRAASMPDEFFLDSYALLVILEAAPPYRRFEGVPVVCERYNLLELAAGLLRKRVEPERMRRAVGSLRAELLEPGRRLLRPAAEFKRRAQARKRSYVEALGYTLAREHGLLFLTGTRRSNACPTSRKPPSLAAPGADRSRLRGLNPGPTPPRPHPRERRRSGATKESLCH